MRAWIDLIVESDSREISIDDLPLTVKQDIIVMLIDNCPKFEEYWFAEQSIMTFTEAYIAQFIFGTEDLENSASEGYGAEDQPFRVRAMTLHPDEIENSQRSVSDNVVAQYAKLTTEPPPVLVRHMPHGWHIIEGGHRIAAAKLKGAQSIRAYDVSMFFDVDWYSL